MNPSPYLTTWTSAANTWNGSQQCFRYSLASVLEAEVHQSLRLSKHDLDRRVLARLALEQASRHLALRLLLAAVVLTDQQPSTRDVAAVRLPPLPQLNWAHCCLPRLTWDRSCRHAKAELTRRRYFAKIRHHAGVTAAGRRSTSNQGSSKSSRMLQWPSNIPDIFRLDASVTSPPPPICEVYFRVRREGKTFLSMTCFLKQFEPKLQ